MNFSNIKNFIRKTLRFGIYLPISNLALVYGRKWLKHGTLRRISQKRNLTIQNYIIKYIPSKGSALEIPTPPRLVENAIWVCWLQGEKKMPELVKICFQSMRQNANGHPVVLLTSDNYHQYVHLPEIALKRYSCGQLSHAHFADVIRMNLLAQQGGLWLDATILLTGPLNEKIFKMPFFSIKTLPLGYFVSECRWAVFALGCHRANSLISHVSKSFENYLRENEILIDYFLFDHFIDLACKQFPELNEMINAIPFNNPDVHQLRDQLTASYNANVMKKLTMETSIFKLNARTYSEEQLASSDFSFYRHFRNIYLNS